MDRSKLSHMISTTRLLPHLSSTNIDIIKLCMFDQLGIKTESQFLCMVLNSLYKTLSAKSLSIIRTKAIEVAENQLMPYGTPKINTHTMPQQQHSQSNMTVYKYIEKQNDSGLCQLHSDIVDYFGTFLTKQESIELGYLNKHLFIETQKQSYLLKRCKDEMFTFNSDKCNKMSIGKNDGFNYTFPRSLTVRLESHHSTMIPKLPYFNNFFRRLSVLHFNSFSCLYCVPLEYVFIKHRNYYPNSESCDNIDVFKVVGGVVTSERHKQATMKQVDTICEKFDRLILDNSNSPEKIRCIKQFEFQTFVMAYMVYEPESINCCKLLSKRLLTRFGSISKSIHLTGTKLTFDAASEIKRFFHPGLSHIYLDSYSSIIINTDVKNIENSVGSLKNITFNTSDYRQDDPKCIDTLNEFDKLGIRRNIKQYVLRWGPPYTSSRNVGIMILRIGNVADVFDKIFFQDYDKHPLLKSIIIKFHDDKYLFGIARLLLYFHQHYKKLFVERKLYLKHFETIEMHIDSIWMGVDEIQRYPHATTNTQFFQQERNKEYSIDDKTIEISSSEFETQIESFGIIYQNIFHWLQRKKDKSCKIIFVIE